MSWQHWDWQIGPGVCAACRAPRGLAWPFFLSAAWPLAVLKPRIKGHRKLPGLILDWHVDGLGRPHQHLHHSGTAALTGQAIQGSGNTYGWVMLRAVRGVGMWTSGQMTDMPRVWCTVVSDKQAFRLKIAEHWEIFVSALVDLCRFSCDDANSSIL